MRWRLGRVLGLWRLWRKLRLRLRVRVRVSPSRERRLSLGPRLRLRLRPKLRLRLRLRPRVGPSRERLGLGPRLRLRLRPKLTRVHRVAARKSTASAAAATMEGPPRRACQHGEGRSLAGMHRVGSCPTGGYTQIMWKVFSGRGQGECGGALGWACARAAAVVAALLCCLQVAALRVGSTCRTGSVRDGPLTIVPVSHSMGLGESAGMVARTRQEATL